VGNACAAQAVGGADEKGYQRVIGLTNQPRDSSSPSIDEALTHRGKYLKSSTAPSYSSETGINVVLHKLGAAPQAEGTRDGGDGVGRNDDIIGLLEAMNGGEGVHDRD
jgi:hypothetical protein